MPTAAERRAAKAEKARIAAEYAETTMMDVEQLQVGYSDIMTSRGWPKDCRNAARRVCYRLAKYRLTSGGSMSLASWDSLRISARVDDADWEAPIAATE